MQLKDASLLKQLCFIDGSWCAADGAGTIDVTNPASSARLATIPNAGAVETRRARLARVMAS